MAVGAQREAGRLLSVWGRTTPSRARVLGPLPEGQLRALVAGRPAGGVLARGAGRSQGDAAQNAGGRVYLAGDSRLSASACAAMYPGLAQWRAAAARLDPAGVFRSDLGQRLGLRPATVTSRRISGATSSGRHHAG